MIKINLNKFTSKGGKMMFANILAAIGSICSTATNSFTWLWYNDEPECPKSLIK